MTLITRLFGNRNTPLRRLRVPKSINSTEVRIPQAFLLSSELYKIESTPTAVEEEQRDMKNEKAYETLEKDFKKYQQKIEQEAKKQAMGIGTHKLHELMGPEERIVEEIREPITETTCIGAVARIRLDYPEQNFLSTRDRLRRKVLAYDDIVYDYLDGDSEQSQNEMIFYDAATGGKNYRMLVNFDNSEGKLIQSLSGIGAAKHLEEAFNHFSLLAPLEGFDRTFAFYKRSAQ